MKKMIMLLLVFLFFQVVLFGVGRGDLSGSTTKGTKVIAISLSKGGYYTINRGKEIIPAEIEPFVVSYELNDKSNRRTKAGKKNVAYLVVKAEDVEKVRAILKRLDIYIVDECDGTNRAKKR